MNKKEINNTVRRLLLEDAYSDWQTGHKRFMDRCIEHPEIKLKQLWYKEFRKQLNEAERKENDDLDEKKIWQEAQQLQCQSLSAEEAASFLFG